MLSDRLYLLSLPLLLSFSSSIWFQPIGILFLPQNFSCFSAICSFFYGTQVADAAQ